MLHRKITLIDGVEIIFNDTNVAEKMNNFFSDAVSKLNIIGYQTDFFNTGHDKINNSIQKLKDHPSILNKGYISMKNSHFLRLAQLTSLC